MRRLPALTVLAHPDLGRIGERVLLGELAGGRPARLARNEPHFISPSRGRPRPLEDRFISRTPLRLRSLQSGAVRFERGDSQTSLAVDGVSLVDHLEVPAARLEAGAVVVLAERITLLLHRAMEETVPAPPAYGLVGESDALRALRRTLSRVAAVDVPVLVRGPTGSGKELVAQALHEYGPRPEGPFVAVNVGALAPTLAVSELFGVRKGAYTGSVRDQPGASSPPTAARSSWTRWGKRRRSFR